MDEYDGSVPGQVMFGADEIDFSDGTLCYHPEPEADSIVFKSKKLTQWLEDSKSFDEPQIVDDKVVPYRGRDVWGGVELTDDDIEALRKGKLLQFNADEYDMVIRHKKGE